MRSLATTLIACLWLFGCSEQASLEPADQMVRPARIMTVLAAESYREYEFVGRVEAAKTVDLSFQVGGPLARLPVLEGQTLKRGDLVAALEPNDFQLALREAEAQLKLASQDLERKVRVLAEQGIAQSAVDDARSLVELREVQLDRAREMMADSTLTAPFDAYVARRYLDNFSTVRALEPVVRLHDLNELLIVTSIPEAILATATPDQVIGFSAEFGFTGDKKFPLAYRENRGEAEQMAQTYEVSFAMPRPDDFNILPGMTAMVTVRLTDNREQRPVTWVPASAIVADAENRLAVWVYNPATSLVDRRLIKTGTPKGQRVPVMTGLEPGEQVVVAGASQLVPGMRIVPLPAEA